MCATLPFEWESPAWKREVWFSSCWMLNVVLILLPVATKFPSHLLCLHSISLPLRVIEKSPHWERERQENFSSPSVSLPLCLLFLICNWRSSFPVAVFIRINLGLGKNIRLMSFTWLQSDSLLADLRDTLWTINSWTRDGQKARK